MHQVEREKHQMKKRYVRYPVSRGDLAHRQIEEQFADVLLDNGARLVKSQDASLDLRVNEISLRMAIPSWALDCIQHIKLTMNG
jgi:hypothetical protein